MSASDFSQLNTLISVKEGNFLSTADYEALINAKSDQEILRLLEDTHYDFSEKDLANPDDIEDELIDALAREYRALYAESPNKDLIDVFGCKYGFHNLKVYLKLVATDLDFEHLIIPIGRYTNQNLFHLAQTLESSVIDPTIVANVRETWEEYTDYEDTEAIDVGIDMSYFDYLREIEGRMQDEYVTGVVNMKIDFYNMITGLRGLNQNKPNSFMYEMMSDKGTIPIAEMIEVVRGDAVADYIERRNPLPYDVKLNEAIQQLRDGQHKTRQVEDLRDLFIHEYLEAARLNSASSAQVLRYLSGREMEVKNLRLIIIGRANQLNTEDVKERMRPIHGERL